MKRFLLCILLAFIMAIIINGVIYLLGFSLPVVASFFIGVLIWLSIAATLDPFKRL